jgi:LAO/AO transport system kinase
MAARADDNGVFIRSVAAAGGHGALAEHVAAMVHVLEGFGFDVVLVETVGAGQGDTVVREMTDVVVLLLQPETGDDLQWEKAGLLEVADVVAIHKADLPGAAHVEAEVRAALGMSSQRTVPVLRVSAQTGEGIEALWAAVAACPKRRTTAGTTDAELLRLARELLARWFRDAERQDPEVQPLLTQWRQGVSDRTAVAATLLELAGRRLQNRARASL